MTLREYAANFKTAMRVPLECSPRLVWKFAYNFGWRNLKNINQFEKRQAKGDPFFPAFIMISITETCNLSCSGCWVTPGGKKTMTPEQLDGIITESKKKGSYFFGILGGEPLLYKGLFEILEKHSDCYFQLFTNGMLITDDIALRMKKLGNITPLISIEGLKEESDHRRGKNDVFNKSLSGVKACKKAKLIFGAAASICKSNYNDLVSREYIDLLAKEGAHYLWYYIYRPVGPKPNVENALDKEEIYKLRKFIVEQRKDAPLFIIETYWDAHGNALCPAATGMSHHISPNGAVEFCPPLQMAKEYLNQDASNLTEVFEQSDFLSNLRALTVKNSRGCILLEDPRGLAEFLEKHNAVDTTTRNTVISEYKNMIPVAGHDQRGREVPEKNIFYKLMKKKYFFGFGAYG
ncbi:radical SAM protein [Plebeiibacterium sediminum]|uniref:Radical SAM protein n=1 Tax=Plebeiibacterium sediminum TaxID=2992112 RepID=A0AAE3M0Z6_9BACT|nr:radical SAM protein [Plebeiobacterium sediminum]MCW3785261.1 radical SAM protein [Plebeiobacterium sediminum]